MIGKKYIAKIPKGLESLYKKVGKKKKSMTKTVNKFKKPIKAKTKKVKKAIKKNKEATFFGAAAVGTAGLGGLMIAKKEPNVSIGKGFIDPTTGKYVPSLKQVIKKKRKKKNG
jgi:fructose-bisphosphate aldolase class 1